MIKALIFQQGESNKFWRVSVEGALMTVLYGRIGSNGRSDTKEFESNAAAEKEASRMIAEKIKKRYREDTDCFGETDFWNIIERAKKSSEGDIDMFVETVGELLETRTVLEIIAFGNIFSKLHRQAYRSDWWGAAYLINGGCSDDGFEDFRAWVISRGEKVYYAAWENPESLVKCINKENIGECEAEIFTYCANQVYEKKTQLDDFYDKLTYIPMPELIFDWEEEDGSLYIKFPKLFKKCKALGLY